MFAIPPLPSLLALKSDKAPLLTVNKFTAVFLRRDERSYNVEPSSLCLGYSLGVHHYLPASQVATTDQLGQELHNCLTGYRLERRAAAVAAGGERASRFR